MHSTYSDGVKTPEELVRMYSRNGFDIIALTDHDGTEGIKEAQEAGEKYGIRVIPGIELATLYILPDGTETELHILGYDIDRNNRELSERLVQIREQRRVRNEKLLTYINNQGYSLEYDDLIERPGQTFIGKPNFARALKRKGYDIPDMWDMFDRVKKEKITSEEGIRLIKNAGGTAVLAHPFKTRNLGEKGSGGFTEKIKYIVSDLKDKGLSGIECYHPSAGEADSEWLVELAGRYGLVITRGSDFHE